MQLSAMATEYATSYEHTTTTTEYSTTQTTSSGVIDRIYMKSIPGILKLVEMVLGFVAFILVAVSAYYCPPLDGVNGFYEFATIACVITTAALYIILVFKLQFRIFRCQCIFWPFVEMCYYIGAVVLLLLGVILMSAAACTDLLKAAAAFGWFALFAYAADLVLAIIAFRKARTHRSETTTTHHETTTSTRY